MNSPEFLISCISSSSCLSPPLPQILLLSVAVEVYGHSGFHNTLMWGGHKNVPSKSQLRVVFSFGNEKLIVIWPVIKHLLQKLFLGGAQVIFKECFLKCKTVWKLCKFPSFKIFIHSFQNSSGLFFLRRANVWRSIMFCLSKWQHFFTQVYWCNATFTNLKITSYILV